MNPMVSEAVRLAQRLAQGAVIGFPTETVYGVGASVRCPSAIARIFEIKRRPLERPLIVHVSSVGALGVFGRDVPRWATRAASALWPGPLTIVVPASANVPPIALGGGSTVGLRAPRHALARSLIEALALAEGAAEGGLVGTSANDHGAPPATTAQHVRDDHDLADQLDGLLDGGPCPLGIESTVVADGGGVPRILRAGAIDAATLADACGERVSSPRVEVDEDAERIARRRTRLVSRRELGRVEFTAGDLVLAASSAPGEFRGARWIELPASVEERARVLFATLRSIPPVPRVWIELAEDDGVGVAINARLRRWAAERERD